MKGLYHRALEIKRQSQPVDDESHITAEERTEINAEIEQAVDASRSELQPEALTFIANRNGASLPILINVVALVLLAAAVPLLLTLFDAQEETLVRAVQTPAGAEGQLLATLRQEAERQLAQKDREIAEGVARVEALQSERDRLRMGMADKIRERELELETELEARLAREAERLKGRSDDGEIQQRLAELETRLRERFDRQLSTFAEREEVQVERQIAELEDQIQTQTRDLEQASAEVARLANINDAPPPQPVPSNVVVPPLSFSDRERLAIDQVRAGYLQVSTLVQRGDFAAAEVQLDLIGDLVSSESFTTSTAVREIAQLERTNIQALREMIDQTRQASIAAPRATSDADRLLATVVALTDQADRRLREGDTDSAETLYTSALAEIPGASRSLDQIRLIDRNRAQAERVSLIEQIQTLESRVEAQSTTLQETSATLEDTQESVEQLKVFETASRERERELKANLAIKRNEYTQQSRSQVDTPVPDVITLLRVKAELKEKMDSPAVRANYPDLYGAMEEYLEQVGRLKEHTAEQAALQKVLSVLSGLVDRDQPTNASADLFEAILADLEELVQLP